MTDRENALLMQFEIEKMAKEHGLPIVCIIGIPDENSATRSAYGLNGERGANNRRHFTAWFNDYMTKLASQP